MKKITIIITSIISIFFLVFIYFYELKKIDFFDNENIFWFVWKNLTWDSSNSENIFYKKWDKIEYSFFIEKEFNWNVKISTEKIDNLMKDYHIYINNEKINKDNLKNIKVNSNTIIKFKWIAKNNKLSENKEEKLNDFINIEILSEEKIITDEINYSWSVQNINLSNSIFNSNINNLLIVSWENLEQISYINIGWVSFTPKFENNKLYIWIDKNTFSNWEYFVIFQLKNKNIIYYPKKIYFSHDDNSINISAITPNKIKNDIDRYIVIQWNNLSKVIRVQLSNNVVLKETNFNIINDNVISIKIPSWLNPWDYYINFMWTFGIFELNNSKFTVIK